MTTFGSLTHTYSASGNQLTAHSVDGSTSYNYEYDHLNQLTRVATTSGNTQKATFAWDALGRRIEFIDSKNTTTTRYYYDGANQACDYDQSGTRQRFFVHGLSYIDEHLMLWKEGASDSADRPFYYIQDALYNVLMLVDRTGALVERYAYDPYGLPLCRECCGRGDLDNDTVLTSTDQTRCQDVKNNLKWDPRADLNDSGDVNSTDLTLWSTKDATWDSTVVSGSTPQVAQAFSDVGNPFMFQGLPFFALDSATSATSAKLPLIHARARFLDPVTGRWLTQDPLGYLDGFNLYEAIWSNLWRWLDPSGLDGIGDDVDEAIRRGQGGQYGGAMRRNEEQFYERVARAGLDATGGEGHVPVLDPGTAQTVVQNTADTIVIVDTVVTGVIIVRGGIRAIIAGGRWLAGRSGREAVEIGVEGGRAARGVERATGQAERGAAERGPPTCFAAGTMIAMADGSLRPIEEIDVGDWVLCDLNPEADDGPEVSQVEQTFCHITYETLFLQCEMNGAMGALTTTAKHPIFDHDATTYHRAEDFVDHATLRAPQGCGPIVIHVGPQLGQMRVFNLEVGDGHNYYVVPTGLATGILVHNKPELDPPLPPRLPGEPTPPPGLVPNPDRPGSWGEIGSDGRFVERWRFDKGEVGKPGWGGKDHVHLDGGKEHLPPETEHPDFPGHEPCGGS